MPSAQRPIVVPFSYSQKYLAPRARNERQSQISDDVEVFLTEVEPTELERVFAYGPEEKDGVFLYRGDLYRHMLTQDEEIVDVASFEGILRDESANLTRWRDYPFHLGTPSGRNTTPADPYRRRDHPYRSAVNPKNVSIYYGPDPRGKRFIDEEVRQLTSNDRSEEMKKILGRADRLLVSNGSLFVRTQLPQLRFRAEGKVVNLTVVAPEEIERERLVNKVALESYMRDESGRKKSDLLVLPASSSGFVELFLASEEARLAGIEVLADVDSVLSFSTSRLDGDEFASVCNAAREALSRFRYSKLSDFGSGDAIRSIAPVFDVIAEWESDKADEVRFRRALDIYLEHSSSRSVEERFVVAAARIGLDYEHGFRREDEADLEALTSDGP